MKYSLLFFALLSTFIYGQQIQGIVQDQDGETLVGVRVDCSNGEKARTDLDGVFQLSVVSYPVELKVSFADYKTERIELQQAPEENFVISLSSATQELEGVVVSASRHAQKIEEVAISLEIIKPELIENKGITNVSDAINQTPGVNVMEGQVSIRGGSGFSYGAGSRVMLVWNDIPLLSGDAGDAKWESIPMESLEQIEVLKGAASVLYGSGALNGIISIRDKEPTLEGETKLSYQVGLYDRPKRKSLRWSDRSKISNQFNVYNGKMVNKKFGYTLSAYGYNTDGYREGEKRGAARLNGSFLFKPGKTKRLKLGLNYSVSMERKTTFIIWESDTLAYQPSGGLGENSTLSSLNALRVMLDPYAVWYDGNNNKHSLQTRYYNTTNQSTTGASTSAKADVYYADYKFEHRWGKDWILTAGLTGNWGVIHSDLYGQHSSENYSIYTQLGKKIGNWDFTAGMRGEYFKADELRPDSKFNLSKDGAVSIPVRPIFRAGVHHKVAEFTHLRASFGQAYRYPSIAERFASTSIGALNIFPNQDLQAEKGWSAEIGVKQGFKIGDNFKGFADVAGFINEYRNMMEFTFGYYKPDSLESSIFPSEPGFVGNWYGFSAQNAEHARIMGVELSVNGTGNIGPVEVSALMGYTYMNPVIVNPDSTYIYGDGENGGLSNPDSRLLKYRFRHLVRANLQVNYKRLMAGISARYNSFVENIDATFETGANIYFNEYYLTKEEVLVGLKEYREKNNKGDMTFDALIGYRVNDRLLLQFIVNNLFNRENMSRPGDIQAPREFVLRLQAHF